MVFLAVGLLMGGGPSAVSREAGPPQVVAVGTAGPARGDLIDAALTAPLVDIPDLG